MAAPYAPRLARAAAVPTPSDKLSPLTSRTKAMAAFVTGAALFITAAAAMISQGADARGPGGFFSNFVNMPLTPYADGRTGTAIHYLEAQASDPQHNGLFSAKDNHARLGDGDDQPHRRHGVRASFAANASQRQPVCVRLCDGYFFPSAVASGAYDVKGEEAQCASLCPDAPTEVYFKNGSDKIEDAFSPKGERYSALPVSLRYRSTLENTCTCHRDPVTAVSPLGDTTLRRGDAVMTPAGFLVFRGAEGGAHNVRDFAALNVASMSKDQRNTLQGLDRVSVVSPHSSLNRWLAARPSTAPVLANIANLKTKRPDTRIRLVEALSHLTN